jgi:23S rRNA (guanine2445-N2)-methyltransferase / 23S rRNA (guanine2069-N7)-methyltransferase
MMEFYATCASGLEGLLADELRSLAIPGVRPLRGQVAFAGSLEDAYVACLGSGLASRIVCVIARIDASDADALYEGMAGLGWEDHLAPGRSFMVDAHGTNASLRDSRFVALRCKDAVSDRMVRLRGARPATDTASPDMRLAVRLHGERASVGIDLAGEPLFRRGYGTRGSAKGLRADYACACMRAGGLTIGDTCGIEVAGDVAGTLTAEAVLLMLGIGPGALRGSWAERRWLGHDEEAWRRAEARLAARAEDAGPGEVLIRTDELAAARHALDAAGVGRRARLVEGASEGPALAVLDLSRIHPDQLAEQVAALADARTRTQGLVAGSALVSLGRFGLSRALGIEPALSVATRLGRDEAILERFDIDAALPEAPHVDLRDGHGTEAAVLLPQTQQFADRLRKVARERARWARREDVGCYRVYDADLPDYAVAIDLFRLEGKRARTAVTVAEYAPPREIDPGLARARLLDVLAVVPQVMGCAPADVHVRVRSRSKGGSQYADGPSGARPAPERIREGGLSFEVDLTRRLDCGIFLDDRDTRAMIRELAKPADGRRRAFLNLFAYTGTASCYAADGGAASTTTVDLSQTYLDWARRNMAANGFDGPEHEFVRADVLRWVREARRAPRRWDLVFCAPPTFSNSSAMGRRSFDVQRDHVQLLIDVSRLLAAGGVAVFSCNLRTFSPDEPSLAKAGVRLEDVTARTIPHDFARTPKVHRCYLVRRAREMI